MLRYYVLIEYSYYNTPYLLSTFVLAKPLASFSFVCVPSLSIQRPHVVAAA